MSGIFNTVTRMTGLSGMDTQTFINSLIKADQVPLRQLEQKKEIVQWTQDEYHDITKGLKNIKDTFFNLSKPNDNILSSSAISSTSNPEEVLGKVKLFIESYNNMIDKLDNKISGVYDRSYRPLTEEQKDQMSDSEILEWNKKGKIGLLRNNSILKDIKDKMVKSMTDPIKDSNITLKDIGISSTSYKDNGKLYIDETKFLDTIKTKPEEVQKLLNGVPVSTPYYTRRLTTLEKESRYSGNGVFQRISDLIENNISVLRDSFGQKGTLIEKAGIDNDFSFVNNTLYLEIKNYNRKINDFQDKINLKEASYYLKYSKLEEALQKMSAQSSWLSNQISNL